MGLDRKVPLKRTTELKRGAPLQRSAIKRRPTRSRNAFSDDARRDIELRSRGMCEVTVEHACSGRATHLHHICRRWHGKGEAENGLNCCERGHAWVHGHVALAQEFGWLRRSGSVHD